MDYGGGDGGLAFSDEAVSANGPITAMRVTHSDLVTG